jgi:hypothetical protein
MDKVWMRSFVGESLSCSLQGGVHAAWAGTQSFLQKTHQPFSSVNITEETPRSRKGNHITHYLIEERLLPACLLVREALATLLPDGQYMLEANGSLSHLG